MSTYAIGDVQGCFEPLQRLLARLRFDRRHDRLWFVGDLVNRGPESLRVLRFVRELGDRAVTVLGNHDLHLVAVDLGVRALKGRDTFAQVLEAPDGPELVGWLRRQPVLHQEDGFLLVHAGLHPAWDPAQAAEAAREVEVALQGPELPQLLAGLYEPATLQWRHALLPGVRAAAALRVLVSLRACDAAGRLCHAFNGPPEETPKGCTPWFSVPGRRSAEAVVVFGHWAALGLRVHPKLLALDSGCVWGGALSAIRLEDRAVFQVPANE